MPATRRSAIAFLKAFLMLPASRSVTARTLAKLVLASMKLLPVALAAQFTGLVSLLATFWHSDVSRVFLCIWAGFGFVQIYFALHFVRGFWRDRDRVARVRLWIRRWTVLATCAGIIWGVAGAAFLVPVSGILQVVTVAVIVAVTFASWPVYSCWMPSLTFFTLLSLAPMTISVAVQYGVSQTIMALVLLVVTVFILYSGRRLNEMILSSILMDDENRRLVERLKREVSRTEAARRATQAESERRARFFAAANHDLRQPLQAMGIYLNILKRRATPQTAPVIEQVSTTMSVISTLVEQVLEVTRMEFGRLEMHPEVISIPALLTEVDREFRPVAEEKGLRFRVRPINAAVRTDPVMLRRALKNLITNAIRYTEKPGGEIVVAARLLGGARVSIGVYDSGPGLTKNDIEKIFDTFYRGDAAKASSASGFGLGLSIVKGLCRQLGIELSVGSRLGRGSVFRLVLDLSEAEQVRLFEHAPEGRGDVRRFEGTAALIEDNAFVQTAMRDVLESWGASVVSDAAPSEAFWRAVDAAAKKHPPLVLISDYNLGEGVPTGLNAAGMLEKRLGRPVPAVLITAVARDLIEGDFEREHSGEAGAGGPAPEHLPVILQKPCSAEALNEAVFEALKRFDGEASNALAQEQEKEAVRVAAEPISEGRPASAAAREAAAGEIR